MFKLQAIVGDDFFFRHFNIPNHCNKIHGPLSIHLQLASVLGRRLIDDDFRGYFQSVTRFQDEIIRRKKHRTVFDIFRLNIRTFAAWTVSQFTITPIGGLDFLFRRGGEFFPFSVNAPIDFLQYFCTPKTTV